MGKSPGHKDGEDGIPFNYGSGDLLKKIIAYISLDWLKDCLLINPVFCADCTMDGDGKRIEKTPTVKEMEACSFYFDALVQKCSPKYMLALGSVAHRALVGESTPMEQIAGHEDPFKTRFGIPAWTIYHPAYILRHPPDVDLAKRKMANTIRSLKMTMFPEGNEIRSPTETAKLMGISKARAVQRSASSMRRLRWPHSAEPIETFIKE